MALQTGKTTIALLAAWLTCAPLTAKELHSYALVRDNGTLSISGKTVHLAGIYIPETGRTCRTRIVPVRCGARAVLALDSKVSGFIRCEVQQQFSRREVAAVCYARELDLGQYLISQGWAVALPDAPFHYQVEERIAKQHYRGIWGVPVSRTQRP